MKQITFDVTRITVMQGSGPDKVSMETTLTEGCWPYTEPLTLHFDVAANSGVSYVETHFGTDVPLYVISCG
jgi:hypothetical protein